MQRWTGLTVGVGIAPTKTLAKLANYAAKKWPATGGVVDLRDEGRRAKLMTITPVEEVWGVGRKLTAKLNKQGINTVADLVAADPKSLRRQYGVVVERTVQELRGIPCAELEQLVQAKQQIIFSRSFGERITDFGSMREALAGYMERAAEKLRAEEQRCRHVTLFIRSSPFSERETYYGNQISTRLQTPTSDTRDLLALIEPLLRRIWQDDVRYMKGGVMLADFTPTSMHQGDLFADRQQDTRSEALMKVIDQINQGRLGKVGEGLLCHQGPGHQRVDDEEREIEPSLHHLYQRTPRGEGMNLTSLVNCCWIEADLGAGGTFSGIAELLDECRIP